MESALIILVLAVALIALLAVAAAPLYRAVRASGRITDEDRARRAHNDRTVWLAASPRTITVAIDGSCPSVASAALAAGRLRSDQARTFLDINNGGTNGSEEKG